MKVYQGSKCDVLLSVSGDYYCDCSPTRMAHLRAADVLECRVCGNWLSSRDILMQDAMSKTLTPNTAAALYFRKFTLAGFDSSAYAEPVCECGSKAIGIRDRAPGHASYCPVRAL